MVAPLKTSSDWQANYDAIIDARSPAEFAEDHIPGAINLPVLNDEERHDVGKLYKSNSFEGRRLGASLISRNIADHLQHSILADMPATWSPLIYCWRGGQRSGSLARVMAETGWVVTVLDGGYKTYRGDVLDNLDGLARQFSPILLQGPTGSAKTHILRAAGADGVSFIDLEGLAVHRGSLLGFEPDQDQPSQKMFDSLVYHALRQSDPNKPILIEAESSRIGACHVPQGLWEMMCSAPQIRVEASLEARVEFLIKDYAHVIAEPQRLDRLIDGMITRHGYEMTALWRQFVEAENWPELVAALITQHYDPAYSRSTARKQGQCLKTLKATRLDDQGITALAGEISQFMKKI